MMHSQFRSADCDAGERWMLLFLTAFESVCAGNSIILYVVVYLAENDVMWLMVKRDGV
jgi:hypothetical protein